MPRKIKGFVFQERQKDAFEEYKSQKYFDNAYDKKDVKVLRMTNQYGQPYTDFYIREGAKPIAKLKAQFGSAMTFEKGGKEFGDVIRISKGKVKKVS